MRTSFFLLSLFSAPFALAQTASAQSPTPGDILYYQKISATSGGWQGSLNLADQLGRGIANLGDMDGDGVIDIAISAHGSDDGATDAGAVWILFLNDDGSVKSQQKISKTQGGFTGTLAQGDQWGRALCALGDLDGDGVTDLAVGSAKDDDGGSNKGALWILFLRSDGTVKSHQKISDTAGGFTGNLAPGHEFGRAIALLDDLNRDGVDDIAVGAIYDNDGGLAHGAVWILFLNSNGTVKSHQKISDSQGNFTANIGEKDFLGMSVASMGDFDGDGVCDLLVGAAGDDDGAGGSFNDRAGAVYLLRLTTSGTVKSYSKISEAAGGFTGDLDPKDWWGYSVANIGDLDDNGVTDIAVGAYGDDDAASEPDGNKGAVYVLMLNANGSVSSHKKFSGNQNKTKGALSEGDWFGSSVAPLGDLNGDGVPDLIIGSRFDDDGGGNKGAAYVMFLGGTDSYYPPVANFSSPSTTGVLPLDVTFNNLSSGVIDSHSWTFGDGGTSTEASPVHTYTSPGSHKVKLSVVGPGGEDSYQVPGFVTVYEPLVADFDSDRTEGTLPLDVAFEDMTSGIVSAWTWDFGNGLSSGQKNPSTTYQYPGTYTVSLAVSGPAGEDLVVKQSLVRVDIPDHYDGAGPTPRGTTAPTASAAGGPDDGSNDGDASVDSTAGDGLIVGGLIDTPLLVRPYGCDANPAGSLVLVEGSPAIGTSLLLGVDNPLGTQAPGATTVLGISLAADAAYPCGRTLPGMSMFGDSRSGELLIGLSSTDLFQAVFGPVWEGPGHPALIQLDIPDQQSLIGATFYLQGFVADSTRAAELPRALTNALEVEITRR